LGGVGGTGDEDRELAAGNLARGIQFDMMNFQLKKNRSHFLSGKNLPLNRPGCLGLHAPPVAPMLYAIVSEWVPAS
jgi:hypothetical protein